MAGAEAGPKRRPIPARLCQLKEGNMKTIMAGALTILFGAIMYPFWPDSAVLGPLWSSLVMGGIGLSIVIGGLCISGRRG